MDAINFMSRKHIRDEDLRETVEALQKENEELKLKLQDMYGAYQTMQYTTRGRLMSCSAEISRLHQEIEHLKKVMKLRGWDEKLE